IIAGPVAAGLIEWLGWRNTFLVFGSWLCLVGGLATLVVRDPPRRAISPATASKAEPRGVTIVAALGDRRLWFLEACWLLLGGVVRTIPDVFGLEALGAITGLLALGWRSGAAVGPVFAGFVYDATGSYAVPFSLAPVALLLSLALFSWGSASRRSASSA